MVAEAKFFNEGHHQMLVGVDVFSGAGGHWSQIACGSPLRAKIGGDPVLVRGE